MDNKTLKATHEGDLPIGDKFISCAVLNDSTRILAASAVFQALERPRKGKSSESYRADQMPSFLNANNLQPFIDQDVMVWTQLVEYQGINGKIKSGYNAKLLRGICKVYLDARKYGKLMKSQEKTADVAEKILYALADKGIEYLVDEATGFVQLKDNVKSSVIAFLERSLMLEPAKWVKTFNDDFFEMIFKMKGWSWSGSKSRPGVVGHYINDLVYARIAPNVLSELKKLNPDRKNKHHQHLTPEFGHPILKDHITGLVTLGRASGYDWNIFTQMVNRAYPKYGETIEIGFAIDYDKGISEDTSLSEFDKNIKKALNYNPRADK